ncbi:MAG: hypothetical protein C0631_02365 [Sedimenticola sp.]|nr:MAG: hypothetical protein C0631_02365 [Sedimenticola sp.]
MKIICRDTMPGKTVFYLLTLIITLSGRLALADYPLEIIELKSRGVEEIIPIIKPFIGPDGTLSGMNNQLIIRTSAKNLAEIRAILDRVDVAPRQLVIHVRQGIQIDANQQRLSTDISRMVGKNAKVIVGQPTSNDGVRFNVKDVRTRNHLDSTQKIMTLEGSPAFIATGQSVPVKEHSTHFSRGTFHDSTSIRYEEATSGFYALPRLHGDRVTIDITPHMKKPQESSKGFDIQSASSVVSGRLEEWIPLAGSSGNSSRFGSGVSRNRTTLSSDDRQIYLMVEEVRAD